eukprot:6194140-Prymnesium_polylepis.1
MLAIRFQHLHPRPGEIVLTPQNGRVGHEVLARMVVDDPGKPSKIKADHAMEFIKTSRHDRVNGSTPVTELHQRENG